MTEFLPLFDRLMVDGQALMWAGFLVFVRVGAVMALLPGFGEQSVPARVRIVLALAFTAIVAPAAAMPDGPPAVRAVLSEAAVGLLLGSGFRMFVMALQTAGAIAAQATSLSQIFGGVGADPQPAIGNLLVISGLAVAVSMGLHIRVAEALILSYDLLPPGQIPSGADVAQWGLAQITRAFALAFSLAAPFMIASLIYNAALGVINRAMPQLMVALVGAPALTAGGLVLLALIAPVLLAVWAEAMAGFMDAPFSVPR
ncbi:MAG: flagellar biosynthetic protein FliR [Gemmobacter sp.]|nr:flagellar biosynthetic protein FliR [Gemmobacter sp.]